MKIQMGISDALGTNNFQSDVSENNDSLMLVNFLSILTCLPADAPPDIGQSSFCLKPDFLEESLTTAQENGNGSALQSIDTDATLKATENMILMRDMTILPEHHTATDEDVVASLSLPKDLVSGDARYLEKLAGLSAATDHARSYLPEHDQSPFMPSMQGATKEQDLGQKVNMLPLPSAALPGEAMDLEVKTSFVGMGKRPSMEELKESQPLLVSLNQNIKHSDQRVDEFMSATDTADQLKIKVESPGKYGTAPEISGPDADKPDSSKLTVAVTENLVLQDVSESSQPYENVLSSITDFFNKKIMLSETDSQKNSLNINNKDSETYSTMLKKEELSSVSFDARDLVAIKIDRYSAKIKVYPGDLGQITADISINKGKTELTLDAKNPLVKHFIENNLVHLRESFENSNIPLSQINIQSNSTTDKNHSGKQQNLVPDYAGYPSEDHKEDPPFEEKRQRSDLIIDTYA